MGIDRRTLRLLGLLTLVGFGGAGLVIIHFVYGQSLFDILDRGMRWYYQLPLGLVYGFVTAIIGWQLIRAKFMTPVRVFYVDLIKQLKLTTADILFISFCAGVGEELLFRAAVQPSLGIWLTAIIFVAIHGYLNPMNWRISVYGILMTFVIAGIGYFYKHFGIVAAASAHFAIDVVLLAAINYQPSGSTESEQFSEEF